MTGFGGGELTLDGQAYRVEIRSYNNRFLDTKVRTPWSNALIESKIVAVLKERVSRGRLEFSIHASGAAEADQPVGAVRLNQALARELARVLAELAELLGTDLRTAAGLVPPQRDLLVSGPPAADDRLWATLAPGLEAALDELIEMRRREGEALATDLQRHMLRVEQRAASIGALALDLPQRLQQRLTERLAALQLDDGVIDGARLAQEVAHLAERRDISEELARIGSHAQQLRQTLQEAQPVGRRIEFLLQELNRELTTIASKADSAEVAHHVVEAKGCLEKMREQALNVE